MKNLLLITMLFISSIVLSQKSQTYLIDDQGNAVLKAEQKTSKEVRLIFEYDVPQLTDGQISELIKNGETILEERRLKGVYELIILFFVPRVEQDVCFLNNGIVSYKEAIPTNNDRMFSWWFLFALLGMIGMILFQKLDNANANAGAFAGAFAFAGAGAFAVAVAGVFAGAFAVAGAGVLFAVAGANNKKFKNTVAYIYYVLMILASIFAYLQI